jgi:hypothetical protein
MDDRNKTPLTHEVTTAAISWLNEHGFKPIETEVGIAPGWIADLAAVIQPTRTEAQNLRIVGRKPKYPSPGQDWTRPRIPGWYGTPEYLAWEQRHKAWEQSYLAIPQPCTCVVEVKTSTSDFRGDRKWTADPVADLSYLAIPAMLIGEADWPDGWGVLLYAEGKCRVGRWAPMRPAMDRQRMDTVLSIAVRRDHNTRYARLRELQRTQRVERNERFNRSRLSDMIRMVADVCEAKHATLDDTISWHASRVRVPEDVRARLEKMWGIARRDAEHAVQ